MLFIFGENPEDVKNFHFQLEEANGVNFSLTSSLKYSCQDLFLLVSFKKQVNFSSLFVDIHKFFSKCLFHCKILEYTWS